MTSQRKREKPRKKQQNGQNKTNNFLSSCFELQCFVFEQSFVPERKLQTPNNWRYVYKRNRIGILDGTTKDASTKDASTMSSMQKSDPKQTFWWKNE
tara:strand:+ start:188 stop:478 length:291 start_codon:yes stop_codon:yes gene_type:complete